MKQNQIKELARLDVENLENIFNVYQNLDGMYFYNLLQTIVFPQNLPNSLFESYTAVYGDTWPYISFKTLNSPNLWWAILLANNINNPTEPIVYGQQIKIPRMEVVRQILTQISRS
jgi:LysM repeat protein